MAKLVQRPDESDWRFQDRKFWRKVRRIFYVYLLVGAVCVGYFKNYSTCTDPSVSVSNGGVGGCAFLSAMAWPIFLPMGLSDFAWKNASGVKIELQSPVKVGK